MRSSPRTSRKAVVLAAVAALGAGLLAGCADDGGARRLLGRRRRRRRGQDHAHRRVFGAFGLEEAGLYKEYEKLHPDIKIKQNSVQRNENYWPALLTHLSSGSGLSDIQAVEVGNIAELTGTHSDKLMDLGKVAGVDENDFLDWKWQQGTTEDGKTIGLGTDVGPTGICYRKDLFEKAGLPSDREEVGQAVGRRLEQVPRRRQAVPGEGTQGHLLRGRRDRRDGRRARLRQGEVLRQGRRADLQGQRHGEGGLGHRRRLRRGRT